MARATIKLAYTQVIDAASAGDSERDVFRASYQEFLLKSQAYNLEGKFKTFTKLKANDGRANSLHYKLGFSVVHFIAQLNNKMPLIKDNIGNKLSFETARFELIESHIEDISLHKVAINYETGFLTLIDLMGEYMLLGPEDLPENQRIETSVLR